MELSPTDLIVSGRTTVERVIFIGANFCEMLVRLVRNSFIGSKFLAIRSCTRMT